MKLIGVDAVLLQLPPVPQLLHPEKSEDQEDQSNRADRNQIHIQPPLDIMPYLISRPRRKSQISAGDNPNVPSRQKYLIPQRIGQRLCHYSQRMSSCRSKKM
jgi:hypothetical protein